MPLLVLEASFVVVNPTDYPHSFCVLVQVVLDSALILVVKLLTVYADRVVALVKIQLVVVVVCNLIGQTVVVVVALKVSVVLQMFVVA